jgi:hypothetical protein
MARHLFGGDWYVVNPTTGAAIPSASVTFWASETGGVQYTDVTDPGGGALGGGVIPTDAAAKAHFMGPDAISSGWVDTGFARYEVFAVDLPARVIAVEAVIGAAPALIAQLQTFETRLEAVEAAAPTAASGVTVDTSGGAQGPSVQTAVDAEIAARNDSDYLS